MSIFKVMQKSSFIQHWRDFGHKRNQLLSVTWK